MTAAEKIRREASGALLVALAGYKFGPVPEPVLDTVRAASESQHHTWAIRVLTAGSLKEVLGPAWPRSDTVRPDTGPRRHLAPVR